MLYERVLFIGSKNSGLCVLKEIYNQLPSAIVGCVTIDDSDDTRGCLDDFRGFCEENGICLDVLKGNFTLAASIDRYRPDLCIVMGWYNIIDETILQSVKGGFIGVHNSLLPAHRGFSPVVWTMIAGEDKAGFSVFSFDKGMDTGKIWYQEEVDITEKDYISDVLDKLDTAVVSFFQNNFRKMISGEITPYEQKEQGISYGAKRTPEDGHINWTQSADDIYNFIRAQSKPYPGAFSIYKDKKITIYQAEVFPYVIQGQPGQIGIIDNETNGVVVVCGGSSGLCIYEMAIGDDVYPATSIIKGISARLT